MDNKRIVAVSTYPGHFLTHTTPPAGLTAADRWAVPTFCPDPFGILEPLETEALEPCRGLEGSQGWWERWLQSLKNTGNSLFFFLEMINDAHSWRMFYIYSLLMFIRG